MSRLVIIFKSGDHLNIPADALDLRDGWVMAWLGENLVAIVDATEVTSAYISQKKESDT